MTSRFQHLLRQIRQMGPPHGSEPATDAVLLQRFVHDRDEGAFAILLQRHGPLVLGACRRILRDHHQAEDAFQATWLVLMRKATSLRVKGTLAGWLYETARRVSLRASRNDSRRRRREVRCAGLTPMGSSSSPLDELTAREFLLTLDEELERLPEVYRLPLILCCLEGRSHEEAARHLGWTVGSLRGRLDRGRARLHARLTRRGVELTAALLALEGLRGGIAAMPTTILIHTTLQATLDWCAKAVTAKPTPAVLLAEEVLRSIAVTKVKVGLLALCVTSLVMVGVGGLVRAFTSSQPAQARANDEPPAAVEMQLPEQKPRPRVDLHGDPLPDGASARIGTVRFRQAFGADAMAFTPDGTTLVSAGPDFTIRFWDPASGKELRRLQAETDPKAIGDAFSITEISFSRDGKTMAATTRTNVQVFDVPSGKRVRTLRFPERQWIASAVLTPDGRRLVIGIGRGTDDHGIHLVDVATGKESGRLEGHRGNILKLALAPDRKTLASLSADQTVRLWNLDTEQELRCLKRQRAWVDDQRIFSGELVFSPDGKNLASKIKGGVVLWEVATGRERYERPLPKGDWFEKPCLAFAPDGRTLAATIQEKDRNGMCLLDLSTGQEIRRFSPGTVHGMTRCLTFSPDGQQLLSSEFGNFGPRIWHVATGQELHADRQRLVERLALAPNGRTLATTNYEGTIDLWETASGRHLHGLKPIGGFMVNFLFTPDSQFLLTSTAKDPAVHVWDVASGRAVRRLPRTGPAYIALAPNGRHLATAGDGQVIHLWDLITGQELRRFKATGGSTSQTSAPGELFLVPAISADGKTLAASEWNNSVIHLWDMGTGKPIRRLDGLRASVGHMVFAPDGRFLAVSGYQKDGPCRLLDVRTGAEVRAFGAGQFFAANNLAVSPDGSTLFVGNRYGPLPLYDVATGKVRQILKGHEGAVESGAFSSDGSVLATAGDGYALIWDLTGRAGSGPPHRPNPR